jgi:hypothetical protein
MPKTPFSISQTSPPAFARSPAGAIRSRCGACARHVIGRDRYSRVPNLRFITHLDIIRHASTEVQDAASPLSIPLPKLEHAFPGGPSVRLANVHVKPDGLFGIDYGDDHKFFALEYDRSTEDVEPTKNLVRAPWLRKVLSYSAASVKPKPIYETYLKIPNLLVLCVFSDPTRMAHVMRLAKDHAAYPSQFLFKTIPPVDPLLNAAMLLHLVTEPWQRIGGGVVQLHEWPLVLDRAILLHVIGEHGRTDRIVYNECLAVGREREPVGRTTMPGNTKTSTISM